MPNQEKAIFKMERNFVKFSLALSPPPPWHGSDFGLEAPPAWFSIPSLELSQHSRLNLQIILCIYSNLSEGYLKDWCEVLDSVLPTSELRQEKQWALPTKTSRWTIGLRMLGTRDYWWIHNTDHSRHGGEDGVRLFGKLEQSKAAVYNRKLRKPHTCSDTMHTQKRPEKALSFHLVWIHRPRASLGKC